MISVFKKKKENNDSLVKRFLVLVKKYKIVKNFKENMFFNRKLRG